MLLEFTGGVFRWEARSDSWFFVALPEELSDLVSEIPRPVRGFGSARVEARIGLTRWRTSIFPDAQRAAYVLPLKRSVRDAEGIAEGDLIAVEIEILDG